MEIITGEIVDFIDFITKITALSRESSSPLWYRGQAKHEYELQPSLYRKGYADSQDIVYEEKLLMDRFRQRGYPFTERKLDDIEALFLMQHYGFPTRLLDWTENPYVGLYFSFDGWDKQSDVSFYVLNPSMWNHYAMYKRDKNIVSILPPDNPWVDVLHPKKVEGSHSIPLAIYAAHNSDRIVAQRGVFTLFGVDKKTMDTLHKELEPTDNSGDRTAVLHKYIIKSSNVAAIRNDLFKFGITEPYIYPGLEGIAKEVRRERGF